MTKKKFNKLLAEGYEEMCEPEFVLTRESIERNILAMRKASETPIGRIKKWFYSIKTDFVDARLAIKSFIQRGRRGWAVSDTWDLDSHLLKVLPEMIDRLIKDNMRADKKYIKDLHDISNTLKSVREQYPELYSQAQVKQAQKQINYAFRLLAKRFMQLWD